MEIFIDQWIDAPIVLPEGHVEFVIGDCHGYKKLLEPLLKKGFKEEPTAHITFLGDVIDRGPDSLGCLKLALNTVLERRKLGYGGDFILGNHEGMMLASIMGDMSFASIFFSNGGKWLYNLYTGDNERNCIMTVSQWLQYKLGHEAFNLLTQDGKLLKEYEHNEAIPPNMLYRKIGNLIMVHAGIDPDYSDSEESMLAWLNSFDIYKLNNEMHPFWIREPFLYSESKYANNIIVHGHTQEYTIPDEKGVRKKPGHHRIENHRLGIDGGSYNTGCVTGALFRNGQYRIITSTQRY